MAIEIVMPKLSDTMEEGKILKWLKHVGDKVEIGDIIAEVETDKADMEMEALDAGVLTEVRVREGESAPIGAVIALLSEDGAGVAQGVPRKDPAEKPPVAAPPSVRKEAQEEAKPPAESPAPYAPVSPPPAASERKVRELRE